MSDFKKKSAAQRAPVSAEPRKEREAKPAASLKPLPELLAPAGNADSLRAALAAGADAVYFGGTSFSNRMRAKNFNLENIDEAKAYLEHPILSSRLIEITEALLELNEQNPELIFGYTDSLKLRSSMTLFAYISPKRSSVFRKVIEKYFYGDVDERTYKMLQEESEHTD